MENNKESTPAGVNINNLGELQKKSGDDDSSEEHYGCNHYKRKSKFVVRSFVYFNIICLIIFCFHLFSYFSRLFAYGGNKKSPQDV